MFFDIMSKVIKFVSVAVLTLLLMMAGLLILMLESEPAVVSLAHQQVDDADTVNELLIQAKQITRKRYVTQTVTLTYPQLNSLLGFVQRALPNFSGALVPEIGSLTLKSSYRVKIANMQGYINLQAKLISAQGIGLQDVKLGNFSISGQTVLSILAKLINWRTNSELGDLALRQVSSVQVNPQSVKFKLIAIDDFLVQLNQIETGLGGSQNKALKQRITYYLRFMAELDIPQHRPGLSLAQFIGPLFNAAKQRSEQSSASLENEAALLALAIYTGHHRLANFVGEVQPYAGEVVMPKYRPLLAQRSDLTQHFVISAAIKILSEQGISAAIGEFKELMDRAEGGSGFSFADLAADMAGVKLAVMALEPDYAAKIQIALSNIQHESVFFPDIDLLPEGLSKAEFSRQYGSVDSEAYKQQVKDINQRITNLAVYKGLCDETPVMCN
jgi:hypothetical protein